jgi:hypothetical protein
MGAVGVLVRQCSERERERETYMSCQLGSSGETSLRPTAWGLTASPTASGGPPEGAAHAISFGDST